jgi:serine/threonine-protein kinase
MDSPRMAVKVLRSGIVPRALRWFSRERRVGRMLSHPNVIQIIDDGEDSRLGPWYAMPLATGSPNDEVAAFISDQERIIALFREICAGLGYLHDHDIIHRDLTPSNILRMDSGACVIADFGLARDLQSESARISSFGSGGFGTVMYAPTRVLDRPALPRSTLRFVHVQVRSS